MFVYIIIYIIMFEFFAHLLRVLIFAAALCMPTEFRCKNGQCVMEQQRCNGEYDCSDRTDEYDCVGKVIFK